MNPFDYVIRDLNLSAESQNEHSALYLVCALGRNTYSGPNVFTNPFREVLRRLAPYAGSPAFTSFAPILEARALRSPVQ